MSADGPHPAREGSGWAAGENLLRDETVPRILRDLCRSWDRAASCRRDRVGPAVYHSEPPVFKGTCFLGEEGGVVINLAS